MVSCVPFSIPGYDLPLHQLLWRSALMHGMCYDLSFSAQVGQHDFASHYVYSYRVYGYVFLIFGGIALRFVQHCA